MSGRGEMMDVLTADLAVRRYVFEFFFLFFLFRLTDHYVFFNSRDDTVNANVTVIHTAGVSAR